MGEVPDLWNLTNPKMVYEVGCAYVEAGSRVLLTNTFGANRIRLGRGAGLERIRELNRRGVELSRKAASGRALVFGTIGPSGKLLVSGDVTADELGAAFTEQARALAAAQADGLVVETMSDLQEAELAVRAAASTGLPVVGCMSFESGCNRDRTAMGVTPEQAAIALVRAGASAIGANCGQGIESFAPLCKRLCAATDRPIWLKPNAGLPSLLEGVPSYEHDPERFAEYAGELFAAGASFIGGCCGTTPAYIAALAARIYPTNPGGEPREEGI